MSGEDFAVIALLLGACCAIAAVLARRTGSDGRDVRLMMGSGAALGGLALLLFSLART